jgi:hypothetical protein
MGQHGIQVFRSWGWHRYDDNARNICPIPGLQVPKSKDMNESKIK